MEPACQHPRHLALGALSLIVFIVLGFVASGYGAGADAATAALTSAAPAGFDSLEAPQTTVVDVYVGGERRVSTLATFRPGHIRFLRPRDLAEAIPNLKGGPDFDRALAGEMAANADKLCFPGAPEDCGRLRPAVVEVIFDEARFHADLFVNPAYLNVADPLSARYLPPSQTGLSAISVTSGALAGATDGETEYNLQNHTVISYKALRLTANVSQSSGEGFQVDTLAAALDRGSLRYQAGLLWAPSLDFFGQGRVAGLTVGSQLDTLANRDQIAGSPILVFLQQRSQVEIYRASRLLTAGTYDAGNQLIDTSALPDGSYEVILRIRDASGVLREERRFFTRDRAIPPLGRPQFQFTLGSLLPEEETRWRLRSGSLYAQASSAWRVSQALAVDGSASLVNGDAIAEAGVSYMFSDVRLRGAVIGSGRGEGGALVDAAVNLFDRGSLAVELRRAWGRQGAPPTAQTSDATEQSLVGSTVSQYGFTGAQTEVTATLSTVWREAQISFIGSYSAEPGSRTSYAYGASVETPLGLALLRGVHGYVSYSETDRGLLAYAGLRFHLTHGRTAIYGDAGYNVAPASLGAGTGPAVDIAASQDRATAVGDLNASASYAHTEDQDTLSAGAQLRGGDGDVGGDVEHDFHGPDAQTRFDANFVVGTAFGRGAASLASAKSGDSSVVVHVAGAKDVSFRVLVNDAPVGRVRSGGSLALFLPPYRTYRVRLAPLDGAAVVFDAAERQVSLYPGNTASLAWTAELDQEAFGRAVDEHGLPIVGALITGGREPTYSDANGFFQASLLTGHDLVVQRSTESSCRLDVSGAKIVNGYAVLGSRTCKTVGTPSMIATR